MRLAVCALSAVLLSGCSWLGMGGHSGSHGQAGGAYGVNCAPNGGGYYQGGTYGAGSHACGVGGGYGVAGNGYGGAGAGYGAGGAYGQGAGAGYGAGGAYGMGAGAGYGQGAGVGYGAGAGYGAGGAYGPGAGMVGAGLAANGVGGLNGAYGMNGVYGAGAGGTTVLGANAPYGAAAYGQNVVGTSYANGQYVQGAGVQTIQGAPIYVPQPYAQYYGVPQLRGVGAAMPFGIEAGVGTEFGIGGDLFGGKEAGANNEDFSLATGEVGELDSISYSDAFKEGVNVGGGLSYDLNRNTTVLGSVGYSKQNGQTIDNGTFQSGTYDAAGVFTPAVGSVVEDVTAEFTDLEQWTIEGGVRRYMGYNPTLRPYVGVSGGFAHNNAVNLTQTSSGGTLTAAANTQEYIDSGWRPTAAATIGAEMAVGPRAAIGVESGIRWRDNLDTNVASEDRWSIPVSLRGRVAF